MTAPILETPRLRIPRIGLGTWALRGAEAQRAVESAIALGYRHIDTAHAYQNERGVGAAVKESGIPREEIWITSKLWNDCHAPEDVRPALLRSLSDLQLEQLDLYLRRLWKTKAFRAIMEP